jgi:cytochrome oxidase Cu insertion factor (SCO1/SenC/PrrC family)
MRRVLLLAVLAVLLVTAGIRPNLFAQTQPAPAALPPMTLKVGDTAPNFTLRDQNGKEVSLKDFQGKKTVVVAFYVFAFSGL